MERYKQRVAEARRVIRGESRFGMTIGTDCVQSSVLHESQGYCGVTQQSRWHKRSMRGVMGDGVGRHATPEVLRIKWGYEEVVNDSKVIQETRAS